jgi:CelD/BcsL family acetyltransferase involved in cellulose biosynthesis
MPRQADIRVRELRDLSEIAPAQWADLCAQCPDATVFQGYEWLSAWWETFGTAPARSRILIAEADSRLVGVFPLYEAPADPRVSGRDVWRWLGDGHADYQCMLVRHGDLESAVVLLEAMRELAGVQHDAVLDELPQFSAAELVLAQFDDPHRIVRTGTTPCPRLRLRGNEAGVEAILRKQSLRRHARKLDAHGTVEIRHITDPDEILRHLPSFFEQHIERWQRTAYPSLFQRETNRRFYEILTKRLGAGGKVLFSILGIDGVPAAYHFGLLSRGDLVWYKPSFHHGFADASPGEALLRSLIEHASACGCDAVDFTRGDEAFKSRFASDVAYNSSYVVTGRRWHGASLAMRNRIRRMARRVSGNSRSNVTVLGGAVAP